MGVEHFDPKGINRCYRRRQRIMGSKLHSHGINHALIKKICPPFHVNQGRLLGIYGLSRPGNGYQCIRNVAMRSLPDLQCAEVIDTEIPKLTQLITIRRKAPQHPAFYLRTAFKHPANH